MQYSILSILSSFLLFRAWEIMGNINFYILTNYLEKGNLIETWSYIYWNSELHFIETCVLHYIYITWILHYDDVTKFHSSLREIIDKNSNTTNVTLAGIFVDKLSHPKCNIMRNVIREYVQNYLDYLFSFSYCILSMCIKMAF